MKNKKMLYILLPLVLIIWGTIIYKILFAIKENKIVKTNPGNIENAFAIPLENDTFSLIANYKDPFLSSGNNKGSVRKSIISHNSSSRTKWPSIVFGGVIKKSTTKKKLALLKINEKSYILKERDTIQGIKVISFNNDSIGILLNGAKKFIRR